MKINYIQLAAQKLTLIELASSTTFFKPKVINNLKGVIHLIDAIEDKNIESLEYLKMKIDCQVELIKKIAIKYDFPVEDYEELFSVDLDHQSLSLYSAQDIQHHNFELGLYRAYSNILNKMLNEK